MKNLKALFNECKTELNNIGVQYGNITEIKTNSRAKTRWGQCTKNNKDNTYNIEISTRLLQDYVPEKSVKTVILHEMLHTCKNCMKHTGEWQYLANKVNRKYGYNIKRADSAEDYGVKVENNYKYRITCLGCGATWHRMKKSDFVQHPENYRCACGCGNFKVEEI